MRRIGLVLALALLLAPLGAGAQSDYGREKKWAAEIIPSIVVGDPLFLEDRSGHKFLAIHTEASHAKAGLVIVHGIGVHPDWGLIGRLRSDLADNGFTTLSVQMPVLAQTARPEEYRSTFPEAGERLKTAVEWLRARGHAKTAIVSHSMGSRMTHYYLTRHRDAPVDAWVCIGWASEGDDFAQLKLPILDLYGEKDNAPVLSGARRRAASIMDSTRSRQVMAPAADHFFSNRGAELLRYVRDFLDQSL